MSWLHTVRGYDPPVLAERRMSKGMLKAYASRWDDADANAVPKKKTRLADCFAARSYVLPFSIYFFSK